ncbi:hypothetical protein I5481_19235 [Citrobacter freundii]|nr:hypothetical protein [Citrobacter freundii]
MSEQLVNLEKIEQEDLLKVLDEYLVEYKIDKDGDIFLENPTRLYLELNKDKGVLRMYGFIHYNDYPNAEHIPAFVERLSKNSYTLNYDIINGKSVICEYAIYLLGSVDDKLIIKSIKKTESEIIKTKEFLFYAKEITEE